ncbi:hypothetical protein FHG87_012655 [Trinorchestia longiramus]|nr:hypothetical protein FHG87_012655 [Trinorchestia longiramus]
MPYIFQLHICNAPNFTQQAYRYGIALSCIGVLLNWLSVAQAYIGPLRFLGVGLLILGSFLIIVAMFRWMYLVPHVNSQLSARDLGQHGDLQVVSVPLSLRGPSSMYPHQHVPHPSLDPSNKPPDYQQVMEKPPTYEEAVAVFMASMPSESSLPPYTPRFDQLLQDRNGVMSLTPGSIAPEERITGSVSLPTFTGNKPTPDAPSSEVGPQSISIDQLKDASNKNDCDLVYAVCAPVHGPTASPSHRSNKNKDSSKPVPSAPVITSADDHRRFSMGSVSTAEVPAREATGRVQAGNLIHTPSFSASLVNTTPQADDPFPPVISKQCTTSSSYPNIASSVL